MNRTSSTGGSAGTVQGLREGVRAVCERFPNEYWRDLDARRALF